MHAPNRSPTPAGRSCGNCYKPRLMAVPKKKTSKARRDKRRATHRISAPALTECPHCHHPVRPHHVCGNCGQYRGREVEPLTTVAP
jgi:large subunit ribosomal protein L32